MGRSRYGSRYRYSNEVWLFAPLSAEVHPIRRVRTIRIVLGFRGVGPWVFRGLGVLGFGGLGFRGFGFRGFGFRGLGFRSFGFGSLGLRGLGFRGLGFRGLGRVEDESL